MNNISIHPAILITTKIVTDRLSDGELAALYLAASWGSDPRGVAGYDTARSLFTEEHGTRMHSATLLALASIVNDRLVKK
jgi:hypothetical protein